MPKSSSQLPYPEVRPAAVAAKPVSTLQQLFVQLRRRPIDLRLEIVLADLLAHGYEFDDFIIRPVSLFARRYRRDLGTTTEEQTNRWSSPKTTVDVHREGLYDALPQELFHHPTDPTPRPGVQPMVEEIQTQRRKEKATRRFFLPLEQEFYRFRVLLEQEERRYMTNLSAQWYNEVLARFWNLEGQLPARQVTTLLYLLPLAHRITGDLELTRRCFESVLETPVVLRTVAPLSFATPTTLAAAPTAGSGGLSLGNLELGRQFVLGGMYQETLPALEISLPELTTAALESFLSDSWQARALQLLCQYFIAFETDVVLRYEVAQEAPAFVLADADGEAPVLGYTTAGL